MADEIVSTRLHVSGVRTDRDVKDALQGLFDIFADLGLGQATFEVTGDGGADLFIKHKSSVTPDVAALDRALSAAGHFRISHG